MIELRDQEKGQVIGSISEEQLQLLMSQMEEESEQDADYYIQPETLEMFEANGIDPALVALLRTALGSREGMTIEWVRR